MSNSDFQLESPIAKGMREFFRLLELRIELDRPLTVFLAGGMAVHLYTAKRVTTDIDAEFSGRIVVPADLFVQVELADGSKEDLYFDSNFSTTLGLIHEDYQQDSVPVDLGLQYISVRALSPVDLAVSKISRLADPDKEDIRDLVLAGLTNASEIEARAECALSYYIGSISSLRLNIRDAIEIARDAERDRAAGPGCQTPRQKP
jgi:hypothetical protein